MRKVLLFTMCLAVSSWVYAQEITGVKVAEVLASDDFEDDISWINYDQITVDVGLNNALGGTQNYNWSPAWGGACVHEGKSATEGSQCLQVHWPGTLVLQGFVIDPAKIYQLEVMIHPVGGGYDWNHYCAVHFYILESEYMWQEQGVRVRVSNDDASAGASPSWFAYDTWEGIGNSYTFRNLLEFHDDHSTYTIDDATDPTATNFWIPLKVVWTGVGTEADPLMMDFYLNDIYVNSQRFTNFIDHGDSMIGLQTQADHADIGRFDNFKLSVLEKETGIASVSKQNSVYVNQPYKGSFDIQSPVYGENVIYELFGVSGTKVAQGFVKSETTSVPVKVQAGVYILKVTDAKTGVSNVVRMVIK